MSSAPNHRRGEKRRQDNGPTQESRTPSAGCNSTHVARARSAWRKLGRRAERRTGRRGANSVWFVTGARQQPPPLDDGD